MFCNINENYLFCLSVSVDFFSIYSGIICENINSQGVFVHVFCHFFLLVFLCFLLVLCPSVLFCCSFCFALHLTSFDSGLMGTNSFCLQFTIQCFLVFVYLYAVNMFTIVILEHYNIHLKTDLLHLIIISSFPNILSSVPNSNHYATFYYLSVDLPFWRFL